MTVPILADMVEDVNSAPTLAKLRITTISLLAFAGFLRCDEAVHIRACDVEITPERAKFFLPRSKNDPFRQGSEVLVARTGTPTCPVAILERYITAAGIPMNSVAYLFRGITKTRNGETLRDSGPLSYTTVREQFRNKLIDFGVHNLRSGGASAAAKAGVPDRLFRQHGRWKSELAKDGYVEDSEENRLSVSRKIGI